MQQCSRHRRLRLLHWWRGRRCRRPGTPSSAHSRYVRRCLGEENSLSSCEKGRGCQSWHISAFSSEALCPTSAPFPAPAWPIHVQAKGQEALVEKLSKNVGTAIGLELRDSTQPLNASNNKLVKAGMTFNVSVGESNLGGRVAWMRLQLW